MSYYLFSDKIILNKILKIVKKIKIKNEYQNFIFYKIIIDSDLIEITKNFFIKKKFKKNLNKKLNFFSSKEILFDFNKKKIKNRLFLRKYCKYLIYSFADIYLIFLSLFVKKNKNKRINLIFGPTLRVSKIKKENIHFFVKENNKLLNIKNSIAIFKYKSDFSFENYKFKKRPILYVATNYLSRKSKILIILKIFLNLIKSFVQVFKFRLMVYVFEDLNELIMYQSISKENIVSNIYSYWTQNNTSYPLWNFLKCKKINRIYIMDTLSDIYKFSLDKKLTNNKEEKNIIIKLQKYIYYNKIVVPDIYTKKILDKIIKYKIEVNKKVLFNFNYKIPNIKGGNNICIFDCNPIKCDFQNLFDSSNDFVENSNYENIFKFITDILDVIEKINSETNLNIKCFLKSKLSHDTFIREKFNKKLKKKYKFLFVLNHDVNLDKIYSKFKTVISFPYTSPSHFYSLETNRYSIFYDNLNLIRKNYKYKKTILINKKKKLETTIKQLI